MESLRIKVARRWKGIQRKPKILQGDEAIAENVMKEVNNLPQPLTD